MRRNRLAVFGAVLICSLILAYLLRDVIYSVVIVPLAYTLWLAGLVYRAVPQLIKWVVLLVILGLAMIWRLIPDLPDATKPRLPGRSVEGRLQALAFGIHRARNSNYFKWQLANRLGRLARRISETTNRAADGNGSAPINRYLNAGVNQSFVDFPTPRGPFARRQPTPLDIDPGEIIAYLESRLELNHDGRTRSR